MSRGQPLILASASTSRARLLDAAGIAFEVRPAAVDEADVKRLLLAEGANAAHIADALAELKALTVSRAHPSRLVLGADQVLVFEDSLLSKCESVSQAEVMLRSLRGRMHELVTAVVLVRDGTPVWRTVSGARLWMRNFSDTFLQGYLSQEGERLLSSVGCYHLEGRGIQLFERIEGDYFSILGLPLLPVVGALRAQQAVLS
jgi:septum formation protein